MKKLQAELKISFEFDANHRGAPYNIGGHWANYGNIAESALKAHYGYDYIVNPSTSFDNGSDIEQLCMSVKSSGASLACLYGDSIEAILNEYFNRVHSTSWAYVSIVSGELIAYTMNAQEFRTFVETWAVLARESGSTVKYKVRLKKESIKMLNWLEERVG